MSHQFFQGTIFHKRFHPKTNKFKYNFYILDFDVENMESLKNRFFGINSLNLFSFLTKDHFGNSLDFKKNCDELLEKFNIAKPDSMRFITLPRVLNFVFNPISVLVLINDEKITHILAEVHNYNNGRVIYPLELKQFGEKYKGVVKKDMYVSPYFKSTGVYEFEFIYEKNDLKIKIDLYENSVYKLTAFMDMKAEEYTQKNTLNIFFKYMFSNFLLVLRTYYQAIKLYAKGLKLFFPREIDKVRRY